MMAEEPEIQIEYLDRCGDCGQKRVKLPDPLPSIGDDFDWDVRDYDGFRLFMLEELTARFQERKRWTPADMEVVLVETLSVVLDQLSDMNDRVQAESFLQTARKPETVRRLLEMIGYKPVLHTDHKLLDKVSADMHDDNQRLEKLWRYYPHLMDQAKIDGPLSIHHQHRIVTLEDYKLQLQTHPLILDVDAYSKWTGSWYTHYVVVRLINNLELDQKLTEEDIVVNLTNIAETYQRFLDDLEDYYQNLEIDVENIPPIIGRTPRYLLQDVIQKQRMVGQEVILLDATLIGIVLSISIRINKDFYRSQVSDEVRDILINTSFGYFAPGNLSFGEDIVSSNLIEIVKDVDGIESVCINQMKRVSTIYSDQSGSGRIVLQGYEVAVLEDDTKQIERGRLTITVHGGLAG